MACELFGYDETEMIGLLLKDLVKLKPKDQATILESHLEITGEVVDIAGKVVGIPLLTSSKIEAKRPGHNTRVTSRTHRRGVRHCSKSGRYFLVDTYPGIFGKTEAIYIISHGI